MADIHYISLLKFGKKKHIEALFYHGHMHCKPLQYFAEYERDSVRGDPYETVTAFQYWAESSIRIKPVDAADSEYEKLGTGNMQIRMNATVYRNLFCLFGIKLRDDQLEQHIPIPREMKKLGSYCLLIRDLPQFLSRVSKALNILGKSGSGCFVHYKDFSKFSGRKTCFEKDIAYEYQKEYRIAINGDNADVLNINIGSLEDIAEIFPCKGLNGVSFYDNGSLIA